MIVYIESNFVLEIALEQEQAAEASTILALAESKEIKLAFPSFVLSEPFENVKRGSSERNVLHDSLVRTLNQLRRSEPHKQVMVDLKPVISILKNANVRELDLLHSTFDRLLDVGECININVSVFREALKYQKTIGLSPGDSIIYATVIADIKARPEPDVKCFLSRDKKAFSTKPDIKDELESYSCSYIGSFTQGLNFIRRFA